MDTERLNLYRLDMKYVRDLSKADDRVLSVSPQVGKESRPVVGVLVLSGGRQYCVPLSSPKPKHASMNNGRDFSKILDSKGKLIGVLNFNNMVPVDDSVVFPVDMIVRPGDAAEERYYKGLLNDQLDWCNDNRDVILRKADKLYRLVTERPEMVRSLVKRCCDFKKLERVLEKRASARHSSE